MKRTLLTIVAIVAMALSASAQQKGEQTLGFNLNYSTGKSTTKVQIDEQSNTATILGGDNLGVGIEYGYFIANNLRVGGQISYGYTADDSKTHSLIIMPNIAYYVRLTDNFYYTPNFSIGFGLGTTGTNDYTNENFTMCGLATELQPLAVEFRPTQQFAMTVSLCSLQYVFLTDANSSEILNTQITTKVSSNTFNFSLLANAQIGFKLYF
jgi:opacity protein-like surface antigen